MAGVRRSRHDVGALETRLYSGGLTLQRAALWTVGIAAAAASVVSVTGIVLIYAGFLFVEQVQFRRKLAILLGGGPHQARVRSVLEQIDHDIRVYVRIKTTLATVTSALAYTVMAWV